MKLQTIFILVFLLSNCTSEKKCQYSPAPIFKPEWPTITNHSFESKGPKATEKITVKKSGVRLELFQTICNNTQQEYHFYLPGDLRSQPDNYWINQAQDQFVSLAELDRSIVAIGSWADQIQNLSSRFILGEKVELDGNKFIMIDKLVGLKESQLVVTIGQIIE